jgi:hypothetical protein
MELKRTDSLCALVFYATENEAEAHNSTSWYIDEDVIKLTFARTSKKKRKTTHNYFIGGYTLPIFIILEIPNTLQILETSPSNRASTRVSTLF